MITLILDKLVLVKVGFSMKDSVYQGPWRTTPHQISHPGGFMPPGKVLPPTAARRDRVTPVRKLYTLVYQPQAIG
jgi:hypothetical protein